MRMYHSKTGGKFGTLERINDNLFSTRNKVKLIYKWPTTMKGSIDNLSIMKTTILYDSYRRTLHSPLVDASRCHAKTGSCLSRGSTLFWQTNLIHTCPSRVGGTQTNVQLLVNSHDEPFRLEIPSLSQSIHYWTACSDNAHRCFGKQVRCTPTGLVIDTLQCRALDRLHAKHIARPQSFFDNIYAPYAHMLGAIQLLADHTAGSTAKLTDRINRLECVSEKILTKMFRILGRTFPSETLSAALNRQTTGITRGDVMYELSCRQINVTLEASLRVNVSLVSARPLVSFTDYDGSIQRGQLYTSGYVIKGTKFLEKYTKGMSRIFKINEEYIEFGDGNLIGKSNQVREIHPIILTERNGTNNSEIDFVTSILDNFEPDMDSGVQDLESLLISIANSEQTSSEVNDLINDWQGHGDSDNQETADISIPLKKAEHTIKSSLIALIGTITSPVLNTLLTIGVIIAIIWSLILTAKLLVKGLPILFHRTINFVRNPRANINKVRSYFAKSRRSGQSTSSSDSENSSDDEETALDRKDEQVNNMNQSIAERTRRPIVVQRRAPTPPRNKIMKTRNQPTKTSSTLTTISEARTNRSDVPLTRKQNGGKI